MLMDARRAPSESSAAWGSPPALGAPLGGGCCCRRVSGGQAAIGQGALAACVSAGSCSLAAGAPSGLEGAKCCWCVFEGGALWAPNWSAGRASSIMAARDWPTETGARALPAAYWLQVAGTRRTQWRALCCACSVRVRVQAPQ